MKWTYKQVEEAHNAMYQAYMNDELSDETLAVGLALLWLKSGWAPEEYDEAVLANLDGTEPGCRLAAAKDANA